MITIGRLWTIVLASWPSIWPLAALCLEVIKLKNQHFLCCCSVAKSCQTLCGPWTETCQASLFFTIFHSLLKLMCIETVMSSNHLIFCTPVSSCPHSFPGSVPFPVSWLFASGRGLELQPQHQSFQWIFRIDFL